MKTVEIDHFKQYAYLQNLRTSPGGTPAFLVRRADVEANAYTSDLWALLGKRAVQLTFSGNVAGFWWLKENTLLFSALRKEADKAAAKAGVPRTVLYTLQLNAPGEGAEYLRLNAEVEDICPLPEGGLLVSALYNVAFEKALCETGSAEKAAAALRAEGGCEVINELPVWNNGAGFASGRRTRLYVWRNGVLSPLTDEKTDVSLLQCHGQHHAYFVAKRYESVAPPTDKVMQLNLATMEVRDISFAPKFVHNTYAVLPNGALVVAGSDMRRWGLNQNPNFYVLDPATRTARLLNDDALYDVWNSVGTDVSQPGEMRPVGAEGAMYWAATVGETADILAVSTQSGAITQVTKEQGAVAELAMGRAGQLYFTAMRGLCGTELYSVQPGKKPVQHTHFNTHLCKEYAFSQPQPLCFKNQKGTEIRGWVIKPAGWQEGAKYPAILDIHGGPKTAYGAVLYHEMQYWAARGFAVLFCNPTGGDGRGAEFADIRGAYGTTDYNDLMAFTDEVLQAYPWIDEKRLGVTGGSYGGFMTNWIIGHTNRFAAAVSQRSIASWVSMALTTDIGYYFEPDQAATTPWENPASLWQHSPLKYANQVVTPTLFIHSDEDYRCWFAEALQMYTALKMHGVPTRLCLFRGENHELSRSGKPQNRVRRLAEITGWFEQYLK